MNLTSNTLTLEDLQSVLAQLKLDPSPDAQIVITFKLSSENIKSMIAKVRSISYSTDADIVRHGHPRDLKDSKSYFLIESYNIITDDTTVRIGKKKQVNKA